MDQHFQFAGVEHTHHGCELAGTSRSLGPSCLKAGWRYSLDKYILEKPIALSPG